MGARAARAVEDWRDNVDSEHIVPINDYSVNMKPSAAAGSVEPAAPETRRYHHGDLRNALIEAGLKLLRKPAVPRELPVTLLIRNTHQVRDWEMFLAK